MLNLEKEQTWAQQPDSRTKMHKEPINMAASIAAKKALRYILFMSLYS